MKSFVALLALAAVAAAEPDAQFFYGNPYVYADPHATAGLTTYANGAVTPTKTLSVQAAEAAHLATKAYTYPYFGYYGAHLIGKRSAEADPQFAYTYTGTGLYGGYAGYTGLPYTYTGTGLYGTFGPHILGKRSADAEADAQFYYAPYYGAHTSVGLTAYANGAVTPTKTLAVQAAEAAHFAAKAAAYPYYGYYGAHLIGKRSAEADPQFAYTYTGTGLYGGYAGYTGLPYTYTGTGLYGGSIAYLG